MRDTMVRAIAVFVAVAVAALGLSCIVRPAAIQSYVLRSQSNRAWKINPFAERIQKSSYRTYLRVMGVVLLLWAALVAVAALISR